MRHKITSRPYRREFYCPLRRSLSSNLPYATFLFLSAAQAENRPRKEIEEAQAIVGKAARITARETREGGIAQRDIRTSLDLAAMRVAGAEKLRATPLFAVFGQNLCDSIARMLNTDSAAERINEIARVVNRIELEEDHAILRRLHYELDELAHRAQRTEKRVTPNKIVPLKAVADQE
jgi:hypothetical protein